MNIKGSPEQVTAAVNATGFLLNPNTMTDLAKAVGENSLYGRTGGAATLAVGMANIFAQVTQGRWLDLWYHFAIMFEALFILTTLDAGTRVGRYMLQDALGHVWKPLGDTKNVTAGVFASIAIVLAWGAFLIMGVRDPEGGVKALWPLFGIANQLLASIALCLGTTIILKMALRRQGGRAPALALVTIIPLIWLVAVTGTAAIQKIFDPSPKIGFVAAARTQDAKLPELQQALANAPADQNAPERIAAEKAIRDNRTLAFNSRVDTAVTAVFIALVAVIIVLSLREWFLLLVGRKDPELSETEPVFLPADQMEAPRQPLPVMGLIAFGCTLLKEVSGQAAIEREQVAETCKCPEQSQTQSRKNAFLLTTERRFTSVNRCC